jgi:hypothetical protein
MALNPDALVIPFPWSPRVAATTMPLDVRWARAHRRLAEALAEGRDLRHCVAPGEPAWIAAQLRVAEARQRCQELADELAGALDSADA